MQEEAISFEFKEAYSKSFICVHPRPTVTCFQLARGTDRVGVHKRLVERPLARGTLEDGYFFLSDISVSSGFPVLRVQVHLQPLLPSKCPEVLPSVGFCLSIVTRQPSRTTHLARQPAPLSTDTPTLLLE